MARRDVTLVSTIMEMVKVLGDISMMYVRMYMDSVNVPRTSSIRS